MCYDLTDTTSFEKARFWVNELREAEENCKIYLCGTKLDLIDDHLKSRVVDYHDTVDYGNEIDAVVYETSSKTNHNVRELFQKIADNYVPFHDSSANDESNISGLDLTGSSGNDAASSKKCCLRS